MGLREGHSAFWINLVISESGRDFLQYSGISGQTEHCQMDKLSVLEDLRGPISRKSIWKKYIKTLRREGLKGKI